MLDCRARARPVLQHQLTCALPPEEDVVMPLFAALNPSAEPVDVRALRAAQDAGAPARLALAHLAHPINPQRHPPASGDP